MKPIALAALLSVLAGLADKAAAEVWDMPTPYAEAAFHTRNIVQFAKDVAAASDGALTIRVHSAGSLFAHGDIKNAVRSRQVPIGEFLLSRLSNEDAAFGLDSLPFLATSYGQAKRLWWAQKPVIRALLAKQGLMPLFSVPWPPQELYTNGEITCMEDLKGLRLRAYNAAQEELASLVGASPVQVEATDIAQAFMTGQVEAMITSPSTGANSQAWTFVSHYGAINAWLPKNIVVVNNRSFQSLPEEVQTAVLKAAARAEARGWDMSRQETEEKTKIMAENGMVIYEPSDDLRIGLEAVGQKMLKTWQATASDAAKIILRAYRQDSR